MTAPAQTPTALTRPDLASVLEYMHPITWFAPMWAFMCGIVSSGASIAVTGRFLSLAFCSLDRWFAAPARPSTIGMTAMWMPSTSQSGPFPSGRIPGSWGFYIAIIWTVLSFFLATVLGPWGFGAATFGLILAWAYSAPPFRLKQNGWWGNLACGVCYEGVPWFTGAAIMAGGFPDWRIVLFATLYSLGAHGIMTLNDFKSVEGDIKTGVRSIPVQLGVNSAAKLACVGHGASADDRDWMPDRVGTALACRPYRSSRSPFSSF